MTFVLVLLFLIYMPTCLYVVGGTIPVYSIKVWDDHQRAQASLNEKGNGGGAWIGPDTNFGENVVGGGDLPKLLPI